MTRKQTILLTISVLLFGLILAGGSFAFWSWRSNNSNVSFNTANNLKDYIEYDEGESQFAGSLQASSSYLTGSIHSTITISKKAAAANIDLVAAIMMDINAIGNNMKTSSALKWVVTNGNASTPGTVLTQGNFIGTNAGDTLTLVPSLEVTTTPTQYTIWIWLDSNEHPSELLSGETLDTNVWTQIDQVETIQNVFEITRINADNQNISVTVVNNQYKITNYAVTTSDTTPSSWEDIPQADQANVYTLNYTATETGTYYVWFKDEDGNIISDEVTVTVVDNSGPSCSFGAFNPSLVINGETSTIELTCTDAESQITQSKLETSDLNKSNNSINITNISKTTVTNGYKYTITVTGTLNDGTASISLPANKIKNAQNQGNSLTTSGNITVVNNYTITINAGNGVSTIAGTGWTNSGTSTIVKSVQYGTTLNLCEITASATNIAPTNKAGYTGCNATKSTGPNEINNNTYTVGAGNATITLAATGIETPVPEIAITSTNKIYGLSDTNLSASVTNTYDSGITVNYTYYYDTSQNGSYTNTQTNPISATSHKGIRYYKVKATATDNTLTSTEGTSSNTVSLTLIRTSYTPDANNCGTLSSSSAVYAYKGENQLYDATTGGNTVSWPTLTVKSGYTFNGWYTQNNNGSKVLNTDGTISSTDVSGYTLSSNFDSTENRTLYAQCSANTYNISYTLDGGTASNPTSAYYDADVQIANPTKDGYVFLGWTSTTIGSNAKTGTAANPTTTWDGSQTTNTYFKNLVESGTVTLVANWLKQNYLNVDTNTYYETLNDAFTAVVNNQTIRVYAQTVDESGNTAPSLASSKTGIKLDLYGHTISMGSKTITNNGNLEIYSSVDGGVITGTNSRNIYGVILNNGTLTTSNTASNTLTIQNTAGEAAYAARAIVNNENKTLTLKTGTTITATENCVLTGAAGQDIKRYLIQNKGILNINGATLTNNPEATGIRNGGINNTETGTINMTSGTIHTSSTGIYNNGTASNSVVISNGNIQVTYGTSSKGIDNRSTGTVTVTGGTITSKGTGISNYSTGTIVLGTNDGTIDYNSPTITSTDDTDVCYGINLNNISGTLNFYDGKVIAYSGTGYSIKGDPYDTPTGYIIGKTTTNGIETATLTASNAYYNYQNITTGKYYEKLYAAFAEVENNQTIRVMATSIDESGNIAPVLAATKSGIKFDLNGKAINLGGNNLINRGTLEIYSSVNGGLIESSYYVNGYLYGVISNSGGTLTTSQTSSNTFTIRSTASTNRDDAYILVNTSANSETTINTGTTLEYATGCTYDAEWGGCTSTRIRYAIYNYNGTTNINGATINNVPTANNIYNGGITTGNGTINISSGTINVSGAGVNNISGTVVITGGTITSTKGVAVYNNSEGTVTLGNNANAVDTTTPIITSNATSSSYYGLNNDGGTFNFYDGKVISAAGTNHAINGTVTDTPTGYHIKKTVVSNVETAELDNAYTIEYTLNGGTASNPTAATPNTVIQISNPTKEGYKFTGWTSTTVGANAKTGTTDNPTTSWDGSLTTNTYFKDLTAASGTVTMVANWEELVYYNVDTNTNYQTLSAAFNAVANNQTIRVYKNVDESGNTGQTLADTKSGVKLDLYGHTISLGTRYINNNGDLEIYSSVNGAVLTGTNSYLNTSNTLGQGIVLNSGTFTTSNTASNTITIQNTATSGSSAHPSVINNAPGGTIYLKTGTTITQATERGIKNLGTLYINGATINVTSGTGIFNYQDLSNHSGTLIVNSGTITANEYGIENNVSAVNSVTINNGSISSTTSAGVYGSVTMTGGSVSGIYGIYHNMQNQYSNITGGTVTGERDGIYNDSGTVTLGTNDDTVNSDTPVITVTGTENKYGIYLDEGTLYFYDGKIVSHSGTGKTIRGSAITPTGYKVKTVTTDGVETATLTNQFTLTLNPNGGTYNNSTSNSTKTMTYGATTNNDIGVATKTGHTFSGWYTASTGGTQVYDENGQNVYAINYWTAAYPTGTWKYADDLTLYAHYTANTYNISYTLNGGTASNPTSAYYATNVQILNPTREGYLFLGWTSTTLGQNALSGTTSSNLTVWNGSQTTNTYFKNLVESGTVTLVANWLKQNYLNVDTNTYYETLQDAFTAVANNQTIRVYAQTVDESGNTAPSLSSTKSGVKLDLYGHTISLGTNYLTNNGGLDIYSSVDGGVLEGSLTSNTFGIIHNGGTLTTSDTASNTLTIRNTALSNANIARIITNGTNKEVTLKTGTTLTYTNEQTESQTRYIVSNAGILNIDGATLTNNPSSTNIYNAGIMNSNSTSKINIISGTINSSGGNISNYGTSIDAVTISGGTITSTQGNGVYNYSTGTVTITGGTIAGKTNGVYNDSTGIITLGNNSNAVNTNTPVITSTQTSGYNYGVYNANGTFNFYDGKVVSHAGTGKSIYGTVSNIPTGYMVRKITTNNIETADLLYGYLIEYNLNGGTASNPTSAEHDVDVLLNNPTKEGYRFTGWTNGSVGSNAKTGTASNPTTSWDGTLTNNKYFKNIVDTGTTTMVANWETANYQNLNTGEGYATLYEAFSAVESNQTIKAIFSAESINETASGNPSIASGKTGVKFDLNGKTIYIDTKYIANGGELEIYSSVDGAVLDGSNTSSQYGVIRNTGTLITSNTASNTLTIRNNRNYNYQNARVIYNPSGATLTLKTGTTITFLYPMNCGGCGSRNIIDNGGTLNINGATISNHPGMGGGGDHGISSSGTINMTSGTVESTYSAINAYGTVNISGGTVRATGGNVAIGDWNTTVATNIVVTNATINGNILIDSNSNLTLTLGDNDGEVDQNMPTINGKVTSSKGILNFYDGKIVNNAGTNNALSGVNNIPDGYTIARNISGETETITLVPTNQQKNYQNVQTGNYYISLSDAFNAVENNQTIRAIVANIDDTFYKEPVLADTKSGVKLDLYGNTLTRKTSTITNYGNLEIYSSVNGAILEAIIQNNGTLTTSYTSSNTLTIRNIITKSNLETTYIYNNANGNMTFNSGTTLTLINSNSLSGFTKYEYLIKNIYDSSTLNINGANLTVNETSEYFRGIYNNGILNVTSGNITVPGVGIYTSSTNAITNYGVLDNTANQNTPIITSTSTLTSSSNAYGVITTSGAFNFYDGKIIAYSGTGKAMTGAVNETDVGYIVTKTTTNDAETAMLVTSNEYYNYLNVDTGKYYQTLYKALEKVANNQTIRVNNTTIDESASTNPALSISKTGVKLDLYGHTISLGTKYISNSGDLEIYSSVNGGVIEGENTSSSGGVVYNTGTLTTSNTASNTLTIKSTAAAGSNSARTIINASGRTMTLKTGTTVTMTIEASSTRYLISNGGTLNINGASLTNHPTATTTYSGGINNLSSGVTNMTSGNINTSGGAINNSSAQSVANITGGTVTSTQYDAIGGNHTSSTITIGDNSDGVNTNSPIIVSEATSTYYYGVYKSKGTFNFYDGQIIGHAGTGNAIYGTANNTPEGYHVKETTTNGIETAILSNTYTIEYNLNGGTASNPTIATYGSDVQIVNPTKSGYIFVGWSSTTLGANATSGTTANPTTSWDGTYTTNMYFKNLTNEDTVTLIANWANYLNVDTNAYYPTLNEAFTSVANNQTIRLISTTVDESETAVPTLDDTKSGVKLDLYGHTISLGSNYLTNNGGLDIYSSVNGGVIEGIRYASNGTSGIITNNGTLTTSNTASNTLTIRNIRETGSNTGILIENKENKTFTINTGTTLTFTNPCTNFVYLISNSGTLNINGAALINNPDAASDKNQGIINYESGTINMLSGTLSTSSLGIMNYGVANITGGSITTGYGGRGVYNSVYNSERPGGTFNFGTDDGTVNANEPTITATNTEGAYTGILIYGGTFNFYDGKIVSHRGTGYAIRGTVSNTPTGYAVIKTTTNGIETARLLRGYNISYTLDGGSASNPTVAEYDVATQITNPTKAGYAFTGWTSTTLGANAKTGTTNNPTTSWDGSLTTNTYFKSLIETGTVTLVANWVEAYQNVDTNQSYTTLNAALAAVGNNETIRVLANVNESSNTAPSLADTKSGVKLDLYGHTITMGTNTITNNGDLEIYSSVNGGVITGANTANDAGVIKNNGTLTTSNTASNTLTLKNTAAANQPNARVIVNNASKTLTLKTGTTLTMTTNCTSNTNRYLIQNSGLININGASLTNNVSSTNAYNRGIYNIAATSEINMTSGTINVTGTGINVAAAATGNLTITGGTITSTNASAVYYGSTGTVTLGTDDATVNVNSPVITASTTSTSYYGLYVANATFNFYDGKVVSNAGSGHSINGTTSDTPDGYTMRKVLNGNTETAELFQGYLINYTLGGGTASNPTNIEYNSVLELTTPTRENYAFTGWTSTTLGENAKTGTTNNPTTSWDGTLTTNAYFKNLRETGTVTLVANWIKADYLNVDTGKYYDNLYDAFDEVASNQTIRVTGASIDESSKTSPVLADTKTGVKLDLYGHTISMGGKTITNNGTLEIYSSVDGALLTGSVASSTEGVIINNGTLTTSSTTSNTMTLRNTSAAANYLARVIMNNAGSTANLNSGTTITMTVACNNSNNRYLITNSGTLNVNGATFTNNPTATTVYNGGIYNPSGKINFSSGTINVSGTGISTYGTTADTLVITGGTITAKNGYGILNNSTGTIILGTKDGTVNANSPVITSNVTSGTTYFGIKSLNGPIKFYDGQVIAKRGSGGSLTTNIIADTEVGYIVSKTLDGTIETAALTQSNTYYNYLNVDTNNSYAKLSDALGAVESNQTIRVIAESLTETSAVSLASGKTGVKLDLYGHTIAMGANILTNNGELDIYSSVDGALMTSSVAITNATSGSITNNGTLTFSDTASNTLEIRNIAAASTQHARVIVNASGKSVTLNTGTTLSFLNSCTSSYTRYLIQNNGEVYIYGATLTNKPDATNAYNRGINNTSTSKLYMTSGSINVSGQAIVNAGTAADAVVIRGGSVTSARESAIFNSVSGAGTVIIGTNDGTINPDSPVITTNAPSGTFYALRMSYGRLEFYDGKAVSSRGTGTAIFGGVNETPVGYAVIRTTTNSVETAQLQESNTYYNYLNVNTNHYYSTLYDALLFATSNQTVRVNNATTTESSNTGPAISASKTGVKLDLYGHQITMGAKTLTNNGGLDIYTSVDGGVITGSNTATANGVILNKGTLTFSDTASNTLEIRNTTGAGTVTSRVLVNEASKTITIKEGTTIKNTTDCTSSTARYAIQNSGTVNLDGGTIWGYPTSTTSYNRGIYNAAAASKTNIISGTINTSGIGIYNSGTAADSVDISGGSITVSKSYAVYNASSGTVTMSGGSASTTSGSGLYNNGSGTITVTGGTVTSNIHGIYNGANGTVNLGTNDSTININSPVITSTATTTPYYGVRSDGTFNYYDGKIVSNHGTGYAITGEVSSTPTGYRVSKTTSEGVETAILTKIVENIYIKKDDSPWNNSNMVVYLSTSATENDYNTTGGGSVQVTSGNVAAFENLPAGVTYYIWASPGEYNTISSEYTGISFVSGNAEKTINYYTFATKFDDNYITSITLDGRPYTDSENTHIVLDNHIISIDTAVTSGHYIYKYDLVDQELNILKTTYGKPLRYKVEGTTVGMILYSITQSGNYQNLNTGTGYSTLSGALQNVSSNQTIMVNANTTETGNATLASGKTGVILDLNGKTINMAGNYISNSGGLDIYSSTGNGSITGTSTDSSHGIIYNTGTLTINNTSSQNTATISNTSNSNNARIIINDTSGNITANSNTTISFTNASSSERTMIINNGTLNINGASLTGTTNDIGIDNSNANAHIIMNSGAINTGDTAIKNSSGTGSTDPAVKVVTGTISTNSPYGSIRNEASGTIRIEGGTISTTDGEYGTIYNYSGTIDITNGIINEGYNGYAILNESGTLNISGSVINGSINIGNSATLNMTGGTVNNNTIDGTVRIYGSATITGGTITSNKNGILINSGGSLTLGTEDTTLSQDVPLIKSTATEGTYYGINNSGTFNFYDGKIVSNRGTNYAINGTVTDIPDGYIVKKTTTDNIETAILNLTYNIYIKNDNIALNNSGVTIYLSTSSEENNYDTLGGGSVTVTTGNVATFENLSPRTTYYIWATPGDPSIFDTSEYTGLSFVPVANGSQTVNYYSFAIVANDANITGATIDGEEMTLTQTWTEIAFLNNHVINITPITETNYYVYKYDLVDDSLNLLSTQYQTPSSYTINNGGMGMILYSREQSNNYENINTGTSYTTLYDALQGVENNETIRVNASVNESNNTAPSLGSGKTGVKLDLNGKTITLGTKTITNNGGLEIYSSVNGGQITGGYTQGPIIINAGTLITNSTAKNTITLQNTAGASYYNARVITNNNGKTMNLGTGTTVKCTTTVTSGGARYIINNNGQLNINGAIISNVPTATDTSYNKGINNTSTGKITINSGEVNTAGQGIYSSSTNASAIIMNGGSITSGGNAISNDATGTVTINNGTLTSTASYVLYNNKAGTINVNDGKFTVKKAYYGIYNSSTGTINFAGGIVTTKLIGIYGASSGPINVTGGTIIGDTGGIHTVSGTITLGSNDGTVNTIPTIIAKTGIGVSNSSGTFNFYDGIIIAKEGTNYAIVGTVTNTATNYEVTKTTTNGSEVAVLAPYSRMRSASEIINGQSNGGSNTFFLNTDIYRGEIGSITFAKSAPSGITLLGGTDISEHTDGSVMMYMVSNGKTVIKDYYIIQSGGVHFPANSAYLFYQLPNLEYFDVDTYDSLANINYVVDTSYMLAGDSRLNNYIIAGADMSLDSVINMDGMFMNDINLQTVSIGISELHLNAPNLENMHNMFALDSKLNTIGLYIDTSENNLSNLSNVFATNPKLTEIYGIENLKYTSNASISMFNEDNDMSLNTMYNVIEMLYNNPQYNGTATLRYVGFSRDQIDEIINLSNWPPLEADGWTTGYDGH